MWHPLCCSQVIKCGSTLNPSCLLLPIYFVPNNLVPNEGDYLGKYFMGHWRQDGAAYVHSVASFHCSLKCNPPFGCFNKAKRQWVSFLSLILQTSSDFKRFRLHSLTPPDFWSLPFLHLVLGFINGLAQVLCLFAFSLPNSSSWLSLTSLINKILLFISPCS